MLIWQLFISNDVRNAWSCTSNYEQGQATGLLLTGMNRKVCDLKFTSVNVSVNMSALRFLSVYCCLFTSYIWWSLWVSQRHVYETWSDIFIDGVEIKRRFTAKDFVVVSDVETPDKHYRFFVNTIHALHCRLQPASTWIMRPIWDTVSCFHMIMKVTIRQTH